VSRAIGLASAPSRRDAGRNTRPLSQTLQVPVTTQKAALRFAEPRHGFRGLVGVTPRSLGGRYAGF
jgi:hypothetical protein